MFLWRNMATIPKLSWLPLLIWSTVDVTFMVPSAEHVSGINIIGFSYFLLCFLTVGRQYQSICEILVIYGSNFGDYMFLS